jgi:transposase
MIDLMVSSDGDVPLLMRIGSGNESDKTIFGELIEKCQSNLNWSTIYVADSALYTAKNLHRLGKTKWLTAVFPLTSKKAQEIMTNVPEYELRMSEDSRYKYKEQEVNYHGVKPEMLNLYIKLYIQADENRRSLREIKFPSCDKIKLT